MSFFPSWNARLSTARFIKSSAAYTTTRRVSRTSAINRGLRSSRPSSRPDRNSSRSSPRTEESPAFLRIQKHTTHDEDTFADALPQRVRVRAATRSYESKSGEVRSSGFSRDRREGDASGRPQRSYAREERPRPSGFGRTQRDDAGSSGFGRDSRGRGTRDRVDRGDAREDRSRPSTFGRARREDAELRAAPRPSFGKSFREGTNDFGKDARTREIRRISKSDRPHYKDVQQSLRQRSSGERADDLSRPTRPAISRGSSSAEFDRVVSMSSHGTSEYKDTDDTPAFTGQCHKCGATGHRATDCTGEGEDEGREIHPQPREEFRSPRRPERRDDARPARHSEAQDSRPSKFTEKLRDNDIPVPVPYSTASSQFLYGYNAVLAALRAKRRQLYQLHLRDSRHIGEGEKESGGDHQVLSSLARQAGVKVSHSASTRMLDKMSNDRPHNGVVLEVSALPALPVVSLGVPTSDASTIPLTLAYQSREEAAINRSLDALQYHPDASHQPFVLFLDGITDPGNIGAIIRSAHFFGVTAIAVATNTCAPLSSPILAKASSGACEVVPLFAVSKPANFIFESKAAGWKVYAAVAPNPHARKRTKQVTSAEVSNATPLSSKPCILMLGGEGEGLRENLRSKADVEVTIECRNTTVDVGVDSVNVSVAAGLLAEAFTRSSKRIDKAQALDSSITLKNMKDVAIDPEETQKEALGF